MLSTCQQHPWVASAPALVLPQPGSLGQPPPLLHCKATAPFLLLAHPQLCPGGIPTHCWRGALGRLTSFGTRRLESGWKEGQRRQCSRGSASCSAGSFLELEPGLVLLHHRSCSSHYPCCHCQAGQAGGQSRSQNRLMGYQCWPPRAGPAQAATAPTHLPPKTEQDSVNAVLVTSPEELPHSQQQSCHCPPWLSPSAFYGPSPSFMAKVLPPSAKAAVHMP